MEEIKISCFEIVSMIIDEASRQFAPLWKTNTEKYNILKQYCDVIDGLAEEFVGESVEVEVDDVSMNIEISLECWDMKIESVNHIFHKLVEKTISIGFSTSEEGNLKVKFLFPSIWERSV